jgi:hypothetical protein
MTIAAVGRQKRKRRRRSRTCPAARLIGDRIRSNL